MDQRYKLLAISVMSAAVLAWGIAPAVGIDAYVQRVKEQTGAVGVWAAIQPGNATDWKSRIAKEAPALRVAPIDAKVDNIWKAIPGYNGVEVDEEKTLKLAESRPPGSDIPWVFREVEPRVKLEDLGPVPIYKGNPNKPMISLMINVAWGDEFIPPILEILNKENVHATFFFDGSWLSKHIDTAKTIGAAGHELSNHAYSHKMMSRLGRTQAIEEISRTQKLLEEKLGVSNTLFAPPSGDFDQETVNIASELKLRTVLWTLDTVDWKNPSPDTVIRRIAKGMEPGSMILMHPTQASSQSLGAIIREAKRRGFAVGTVSELLSSKRIPAAGAAEGLPSSRISDTLVFQ